jgi:hypothetical protein
MQGHPATGGVADPYFINIVLFKNFKKFMFKLKAFRPGMVVDTCIPSILQAEV